MQRAPARVHAVTVDAVEALEQLGGIATAPDLLQLTTRRKLRTALGHRSVLKLGNNRYALPVPDQARRTAVMCNGYVTHESAALHHGWEVRVPPKRPQIAVPRHRAMPKVQSAAVRRLDHRHAATEGWSLTPLATVLVCAQDLPFADALTIADSALRRGDVTHAELVAAAARLPGERGHRIRRVVEYADGRAQNPFESTLRAIAIEAGLDVIAQYEVSARGLVLHPDLVDPLNGVVLEADSWEWHGKDKRAFELDCERYNALIATGWRVLRFTWAQVMLEPDQVRSVLRDLYAELAA